MSCGSSLSSRTLIKCFYPLQKSIGYTTIPSPIFTFDQCFPMYPCFVSYFCIPVTWLWRKTKLWFGYCQVGSFHLKLTQINSEMNCIAKNKCPDSQKLDRRRKYGIELICREWCCGPPYIKCDISACDNLLCEIVSRFGFPSALPILYF